MKSLVLFLAPLVFAGCSSSFQGIRVRAEAPPIEEAFRKLSAAVRLDGYEIAMNDAASFSLESKERELKPSEKLDANERGTVKVRIKLERRGFLYDVTVEPVMDFMIEDSLGTNTVATHRPSNPKDPVTEKWHRIVMKIVEREARDGD